VTITAQLAESAHLIFAQLLDLDWEGWRDEPRDWRGRWAREGSAVAGKAENYIRQVTGKVRPHELDEYNTVAYKRDVLNPAFHYTPEQAGAIHGYAEHYQEINDAARAGKDHAGADAISSAMQPMPQDLILLREVSGQHALADVNPGDVIADQGFSSTTLRTGNRYASGRDDTTVMHILTPAGTPAVWADPVSEYPEDEMILDRGQALVMMKKQVRPGRSTVTDAYFLAVPKEAVA
jgi:hypothetical protein